MSPKTTSRPFIMKQVLLGKCSVPEAGKLLKLSPRQVFRLKAIFKEEGLPGLIHGNRGRKPIHAVSDTLRNRVIELATGIYRGANFTHFSELLEEREAIALCHRTVGRILKRAGISQARNHSVAKKYRRRKRRPQEGELVQLDASPFAWLEERGPMMSLHGAIDDATGKILGLYFRPNEDTIGYLHVLQQILENGIPRSFYTDRSGIFVAANPGDLSLEEQLEGKAKAHTQFGKIMEELAIEHIEALSPQAKGRIERLWGTLQDRLVIELRLANITDLEGANAFLRSFIHRFNIRFSEAPQEATSAFRPIFPSIDLDNLLTFREERKAAGDSTISFGNTLYSLVGERGKIASFRRSTRIQIRTHLDGRVSAWVEGKRYSITGWKKKASNEPRPGQASAPSEETKPPEPIQPKRTHPWRRPFLSPKDRQLQIQNGVTRRPGAAGPPAAK